MGRMDEEQAIFEQLTLSNFKRWSSTALKTFNNSTIIMTNDSGKVRISWVVFLSLLFIFDLIQQASLVNFMLFSNISKILKISFWTFWRKKLRISYLFAMWAIFSWKSYKDFRIAQCRQSRLEKLSLNFDIKFIFRSTGTAVLYKRQ